MKMEYIVFTGTDNQSWLNGGHAYSVLGLLELPVGNKTEKVVQVRNPWGRHTWDSSKSSKAADHNAMMEALSKKTGFQEEGGKFYVLWEDFLREFESVEVALTHESMTAGEANRVEYRPLLSLPSSGEQYVRVTFFEDVDLTKDVLGFRLIQGGNRITSNWNPA